MKKYNVYIMVVNNKHPYCISILLVGGGGGGYIPGSKVTKHLCIESHIMKYDLKTKKVFAKSFYVKHS